MKDKQGDGFREVPTRDGFAPKEGAEKSLYLMAEDGNLDKVVKERFVIGRGKHCDLIINSGKVSREHAAQLEHAIWKHLPDLRPLRADQFGDYNDGSEVRHSDPLALTQLLITYHLLRAYSKDSPMPFARPVAALSRLKSVRDEASVEAVTKR